MESDHDVWLGAELGLNSYPYASRDWSALRWAFPTIGVPALVIAALLMATRAKDTWILQGILPAFIIFSILLGLSLLAGPPRLGVLYAAMALGLLAILPSVKYGFVYGEFDSLGHYSTASEIFRTGSLAQSTMYAAQYAGTPVLHILLAMTALTGGIPIETTIVYVLFLEHFVILVLIVESIRRMFPQMETRTIVLLAAVTLPVTFLITGTTFGLLEVAMLTYVFSRGIGRKPETGAMLLAVVLMFSLVFSHFVTTVYFMTFLGGYAISLMAIRLFAGSRGVTRNLLIQSVPLFLTFFVFWLVYVGEEFIYAARDLAFRLFLGSSLPSAAWRFPLTDLIQLVVFMYARPLFSVLLAVTASLIALLRYRRTETFAMFWWLLVSSLLIGGVVALGLTAATVWRFLAYASLTTPYFLCFLISRSRNRLFVSNTPRMRVIKVVMLATLVLSMIAVYPVTPLYPESGGSPILDDNSVNSIYVVSALEYFSNVYSSTPVTTSSRIYWQLMSLDPKLIPLRWNTISNDLESVTSLAELEGQLVLFDAGGRSGTATIAMRAMTGNLRDRLDIVYSNSFFFIGLGT